MTKSKEVVLHKASLIELVELQDLCYNIYPIYFGDHWIDQGLELYLEEQFGTEKLSTDLKNDAIDYFFIRYEERSVGFMKINYLADFEESRIKTACELEKMYIFPDNKGMGIGEVALNILLDHIRKRKERILILDVLDTNKKGIAFYEKLGFRLHSRSRLKYKHFKEELKGLNRMLVHLE